MSYEVLIVDAKEPTPAARAMLASQLATRLGAVPKALSEIGSRPVRVATGLAEEQARKVALQLEALGARVEMRPVAPKVTFTPAVVKSRPPPIPVIARPASADPFAPPDEDEISLELAFAPDSRPPGPPRPAASPTRPLGVPIIEAPAPRVTRPQGVPVVAPPAPRLTGPERIAPVDELFRAPRPAAIEVPPPPPLAGPFGSSAPSPPPLSVAVAPPEALAPLPTSPFPVAGAPPRPVGTATTVRGSVAIDAGLPLRPIAGFGLATLAGFLVMMAVAGWAGSRAAARRAQYETSALALSDDAERARAHAEVVAALEGDHRTGWLVGGLAWLVVASGVLVAWFRFVAQERPTR